MKLDAAGGGGGGGGGGTVEVVDDGMVGTALDYFSSSSSSC